MSADAVLKEERVDPDEELVVGVGVFFTVADGLLKPEEVVVLGAAVTGVAFLTGSTFLGVVVLTAVGLFTVAGLGFTTLGVVFVGFTTLDFVVLVFSLAVDDVLLE